MPNIPISDHPLIGSTHVYRAGEEPYDPATDTDSGVLILGNGMEVTIKAVFTDWNDVKGLDMLYVYCHTTGYHTHVTPKDLGIDGIIG